MKNNITILPLTGLLLLLFMSFSAIAQNPNIAFKQGEKVDMIKIDDNYFEIKIKKKPFTILFEADQLMVCAGLTDQIFKYAKPNTDINADFNSYFFIAKYAAMSKDADYLIIEKDASSSLNLGHGAKKEENGLYSFKVSSLFENGKKTSISKLNNFYLSLWLDKNLDQFVDKEELLWVKVSLE